MIYGDRIKQARELEGLTQSGLASRVGVTQSRIAQVESELTNPPLELLTAIALQTSVDITFFERAPLDDFPLGSLVYRARSSLKAVDRDKAYQFTKLYVEQLRSMATGLELPELVFPDVSSIPETAARLARFRFNLTPNQPVPNIINVLERHGVIVLALPFELERLDAFSTWVRIDNFRPVVAISAGKPGDRLRFSVAHELGHLVMHREAQERHPILEREADAFAAEFLLPSETMAGILDQSLNLTFAARLKLTWGVSMQAVVRRARDIGSISERRYRYLFEQIGKLGWRKREPANLDIPVEQPRTFKSMIEFVYEPLREAEQLATEASISHSRAQAILAQYSKALESTPDLEGNQYYNYSGRQGNLN